MHSRFDNLYRAYVVARRAPYIFNKVCFAPLTYDHHIVWDAHRKFLQYRTAPPLPGKILHVINRRPARFETRSYQFFSELENIFSLLPREVLKSRNYSFIRESLSAALRLKEFKGLIFQSSGAWDINKRFFSDNSHLRNAIIKIVPSDLEPRALPLDFVQKNKIKFLVFASRYYSKGVHILLSAAKAMLGAKSHFRFTLVTPKIPDYDLPENVENIIIPAPSLQQRRELYYGHDYVLNLSLGDSLGVFLDSVRFATPMIGYRGQHGDSYCPPTGSIMLDNPVFIYGPDYLVKYNPFEFEDYVKKLESENFFTKDKSDLVECLLPLDDLESYQKMAVVLREYTQNFSAGRWIGEIKKYYNYFDN